MAKGPGLYSRDLDIGKSRVGSDVRVTNLSEVTVAIDAEKAVLEEATEELKRISLGTELIVGEEIIDES